MKKFKFRAEAALDVAVLMVHIESERFISLTMDNRDHLMGQVCVLGVKNMRLDELREKMALVEDGHVMIGTVQPEGKYTGERDYDIESQYE